MTSHDEAQQTNTLIHSDFVFSVPCPREPNVTALPSSSYSAMSEDAIPLAKLSCRPLASGLLLRIAPQHRLESLKDSCERSVIGGCCSALCRDRFRGLSFLLLLRLLLLRLL